MKRCKWVGVVILTLSLICSGMPSFAATSYQSRIVTVFDYGGDVVVKRGGNKEISLFNGMRLKSGDTVKTGSDGWARIEIDGSKVLKLDRNSVVTLSNVSGNAKVNKTVISLSSGKIYNQINGKLAPGATYHVKTANSVMGVRGTIFAVGVEPGNDGDKTNVTVFEGSVAVQVTPAGAVQTGSNSYAETKVQNVSAGETAAITTLPSTTKDEIKVSKVNVNDLDAFTIESLLEIDDQRGNESTIPFSKSTLERALPKAKDKQETVEEKRPEPPKTATESDITFAEGTKDENRLKTPSVDAENSRGSIYVSWNSISNADSYEAELYVSGKSGVVERKTTTSRSVTFNTYVPVGTGYTVKVKACVSSKNSDKYSDSNYGSDSEKGDESALSTPRNINIGMLGEKMNVSWSQVSNAKSYTAELYEPSGTRAETRTVSTGNVAFETIINKTGNYTVKVKAVSGSSNYTDSAYGSATYHYNNVPQIDLPTPTNVIVRRPERNLSVSWNPVAGASSYKVVLFEPGRTTEKESATVTSGTAHTFNSTITAAGSYRVNVVAKAAQGESKAATASFDTSKLGTPGNVVVDKLDGGTLSVHWNQVSNAQGYWVTVKDPENSTLVNGEMASRENANFSIGSFNKHGNYTVSVVAIGQGNFVDSNAGVGRYFNKTKIDPPKNLQITEGTDNYVNIRWSVGDVNTQDYTIAVTDPKGQTTTAVTGAVQKTTLFDKAGVYLVRVWGNGIDGGMDSESISQEFSKKMKLEMPRIISAKLVSNRLTVKVSQNPEYSVVYRVSVYRPDGSFLESIRSYETTLSINKELLVNGAYRISVMAEGDGKFLQDSDGDDGYYFEKI